MRRPRFIAEQSRYARGVGGRIIAAIMARQTWAANLRAIEALDIQPADRVLDVGCGPGRAVVELERRAHQGEAIGIDPSELMIAIANRRNACSASAGRVKILQAQADALPFATASVDKALSVHGIYFGPALGPAMRELSRVIRPGGRLALVFHDDQDAAAVRAFPPEVYVFRSITLVRTALASADFRLRSASVIAIAGRPGPNLLVAERR